jgi:hypothetical protein
MGRLIVLVSVVCAVAAAQSVALAQGAEGQLRVSVVFDPDGDGEYSDGDCRIIVYNRIPEGLFRAPEQLPVAESATTGGEALLSLPPGQYSVRTECAHSNKEFNGVVCCQYYDADPGYRFIESTEGIAHFVVQDVRVEAGKLTTATLSESIKEDIDRGRILFWSLVVVGVVLAGCGLAGLWRFRPRYNPTSDARNPKRYEPKEPGHDPAGFDDVFGDFLKKR